MAGIEPLFPRCVTTAAPPDAGTMQRGATPPPGPASDPSLDHDPPADSDDAYRNLPAARSPSPAEYDSVKSYIDLVIGTVQKNIERVDAAHKDNWFYILVGALNVTIALRDGNLKGGPILEKFGVASNAPNNDIRLAYADHYLQMRADAFNLGKAGRAELHKAVVNYDLAKVSLFTRTFFPKTGAGEISPATDLSVFWGLQGIQDGLEDDARFPRSGDGPREPDHARSEEARFAANQVALWVDFILTSI